MQVDSVNAGRAELTKIGARTISTGIRKAPVERGHVGTLGLVGDVVADVENHGGLDQAIYVYSSEDYVWWAEELGGVPGARDVRREPDPVELRSRGGADRRPLSGRGRAARGDGAADSVRDLRDADGRAGLGEAVRRRAQAGALRPRARARVRLPPEMRSIASEVGLAIRPSST